MTASMKSRGDFLSADQAPASPADWETIGSLSISSGHGLTNQ
ncbi:hypothetical protein [Escherichia coli]|nr:hypothetical protein [Escherichia coli]